MSEYRVFETEEFRRSLGKLAASDADFLRTKLVAHVYPRLRQTPYFGPNIRKLHGYRPETWRYRIGRFRVFCVVEEQERVVFILTVDHRKDAYR
ncbi:MAG: type II toxin-antitoxin system RelE/ParE family toxin [Candidatus Sumerlaeota bacterium]|nr:type II toxin-antitoxin system RelE/ParE family toxin [Candidatus Sumerlaeota bacterium]